MKQLGVLIALLVLSGKIAQAAGPGVITFQGNLIDPSGLSVPDGNYDMRFSMFDAAEGGTVRYARTLTRVSVQEGFFSVELRGTVNLFSQHDALWLEIAVDLDSPADGFQDDEIYSPRQRITSAPYAESATRADDADTLGGALRSEFLEKADQLIQLPGPDQSFHATFSAESNRGLLELRGTDGILGARLDVGEDGDGALVLYGVNGNVSG